MVTGIHDPLGRLWTHRDLDDTPEDGHRYEVIDGELHVTPLPTTGHQRAIMQMALVLGQHVMEHELGEVFTSGLKVVLDELTGVGPDVVFIAKQQHAEGIRRDGFYGPPALVVEVLSSKPRLDTVVKRKKYASAGIQYYWIIDATAQTLCEYRLEGADYVARAEVHGAGEFRPELFPRLVIPLPRLWGSPLPE